MGSRLSLLAFISGPVFLHRYLIPVARPCPRTSMSLVSLGHIAIAGGPVYLAGKRYQVSGLKRGLGLSIERQSQTPCSRYPDNWGCELSRAK